MLKAEKKEEKQKKQQSKKRIADEILFQVGRSVLLVFLVVAVVAIFMVRGVISSSKQTELTLQSVAAANQLTGFFEQYARASAQLAVNPELQYVLTETTPGDNITETEKMDTVRQNMAKVVETDSENILAIWIADFDTSTFTQSDGTTSDGDWDVTSREWYQPCIDTKQTVLTDPYVDSASGSTVLSAVSPIFDASGSQIIGAVGIDVSLEQITEVMGEYKIGNKGYVFLLTGSGEIIYHPQEELVQKNIKDVNTSQNVIDAVNAGYEI